MATMTLRKSKIAAIGTCVPSRQFNNLTDASGFTQDEVQRVVQMAGVKSRHLADESTCASDLCVAAANKILRALHWDRNSIDALIMVTDTPDYLMPATSCVIQNRLQLSDECACFDVGLGCSGYPYGLWLATMMLERGQFQRVLLLMGETPARICHESNRSVALLFGDAGSATAIESEAPDCTQDWYFSLHTDGSGHTDLIVEGGGFRKRFPDNEAENYIAMNGANIFNFSLKRVPPLVQETIELSGISSQRIDYYIFHQANQFIIKHLLKKLGVPIEKVPVTIENFGNVGGPSVPLTITQGKLNRPSDRALKLMLLGYGVGLSWASALIDLAPDAILEHIELGSN